MLEKLELVTPVLEYSSDPKKVKWHPPWKKLYVATWGYLNNHYILQDDISCGTTIFTWSDSPHAYTVPEMKRLCTAVVHFEHTFSLIMGDTSSDPNRQRLKRNWRDHPRLGGRHQTPAESIQAINALQSEAHLPPMSRFLKSWGEDYFWNLSNLHTKRKVLLDPGVQYRQPRSCTTANDAIKWAELVVLFVKAAMACPPHSLLTQKNEASYQGLAHFLRCGTHGSAVAEAHFCEESSDESFGTLSASSESASLEGSVSDGSSSATSLPQLSQG